MACITVGQPIDRDVVLLDQFPAHRELVSRRRPAHVEDLLVRPELRLGLAVAPEAPLHRQRLVLPRQGHQVHPAVAARAADPLLHVDRVVEVRIVRQLVDPVPTNRLVGPHARPHRLEHRALGPDL